MKTGCGEGGHTLHVRYLETKLPEYWTEWFVWGSKHSTLEAVSGYPPPIQTDRYDDPTRTFRLQFADSISSNIQINEKSEQFQKILMNMDTTGLLAVTRTEGTEDRCTRAGWCSWDITFMTNVLFEMDIAIPDVTVVSPFENNNVSIFKMRNEKLVDLVYCPFYNSCSYRYSYFSLIGFFFNIFCRVVVFKQA